MTQPAQAATGDVAPQPLVVAPFRWTEQVQLVVGFAEAAGVPVRGR